MTPALCLVLAAANAVAGEARAPDLTRLSLEELGRIAVTSVSRAPEPLLEAPAAIYVITREDIQRSGATNVAEALRLAPNLQLTQYGSSNYVMSARGFGARPDVQQFSNKLLLLIDGRSVYSPLFSGIYLDTQDVLMSNISRIEVISGPGATLWGANAVNGVINIITQPAWLADGAAVTAAAGNRERDFTAQYGGSSGSGSSYLVYAKALQRDAMHLEDGSSVEDGWHRGQAGVRFDFDRPAGLFTLQGDAYAGENDKAGPGTQSLGGANLLGRWEGRRGSSDFRLQGYLDHVRRGAPADGARFAVNTFDVDGQQGLAWGGRHQLVWGAGARLYRYDIDNTATLLFEPSSDTLHIWNVFAQDTMAVTPALKLTLGLKLEHNSYTGWEPQPDVRLAWQANDSNLLWAAGSRAVRAPTPLDVDVIEKVDGAVFLEGNPRFRSEEVLAWEAGWRGLVSPRLSVSLSTFYNRYDDLRTVEISDTPTFLPLRWGNLMAGHTWGMTGWASWQVTPWWRLTPGFTLLRKRLHQKPEASELLDVSQSGNDPRAHALLKSAFDLGAHQTLDLNLRHVGRLQNPELPAYTELSARYAWQVSAAWEVALRGDNLLHERHLEYPAPAGVPIGRSVLAEVRWRH
jgi:iron complex outermembrane receptor protein